MSQPGWLVLHLTLVEQVTRAELLNQTSSRLAPKVLDECQGSDRRWSRRPQRHKKQEPSWQQPEKNVTPMVRRWRRRRHRRRCCRRHQRQLTNFFCVKSKFFWQLLSNSMRWHSPRDNVTFETKARKHLLGTILLLPCQDLSADNFFQNRVNLIYV